jgi:hypothetical protein
MHQLLERHPKRALKCAPKCAMAFCIGFLTLPLCAIAQIPIEKPVEKPAEKSTEKAEEPPNAAQIELLETKYRFESNGDSRKEVHALVKINSELGVRQFARLNFDYNRNFQSVEIPIARITHANGGTSDILPSAITDVPNPAVEKFPAYHDIRVKSVRILGLQPGDSLEYRVITTTTKPPLAPDFWLGHSFDRTGVTSRQLLELDLPTLIQVQFGVRADVPSAAIDDIKDEKEARHIYRWMIGSLPEAESQVAQPDIAMSTAQSWDVLSKKIDLILKPQESVVSETWKKASELTNKLPNQGEKVRAIYNFVSTKITTVDLPVGTTGFRAHKPAEILAAGYATPEDKFALFDSLTAFFGTHAVAALTGPTDRLPNQPPCPSFFSELLILTYLESDPSLGLSDANSEVWLDPTLEVAPFGVIPAKLRGKEALTGRISFRMISESAFSLVPLKLPFASTQKVSTTANLSTAGTLTTRIGYKLRGDNELLLRVAFHKTPPEKQNEIAQFLALSDGFRGKVTTVKTSDPYDTEKPFEVEYELTQEKFVDWSKKPVRIPALLPLPGLPDLTKKPPANSKIDLGTPLDITLSGTLRLPPGTLATAPAGTSVKRDYATYSSKANIISFTRHLNFLLPEIPSERSVDLNAFIHAVQSDQSQLFVLDKPESVPPAKPK